MLMSSVKFTKTMGKMFLPELGKKNYWSLLKKGRGESVFILMSPTEVEQMRIDVYTIQLKVFTSG